VKKVLFLSLVLVVSFLFVGCTGGIFASDEDLAKNAVLGFYNDLSGDEVSASKIVDDYFYIEDLTATEKDQLAALMTFARSMMEDQKVSFEVSNVNVKEAPTSAPGKVDKLADVEALTKYEDENREDSLEEMTIAKIEGSWYLYYIYKEDGEMQSYPEDLISSGN